MRTSGILMHITSLPSKYGVGCLANVDKFIKFLVKAKQHYWQILPINPADFVNSPYASASTFAGNTLLIDPLQLVEDGLVSQELVDECSHCKGNDYGYAKYNNERIMNSAYKEFCRNNPPQQYHDFVNSNAHWLESYSLFCSLKEHFGGVSWIEWSDESIRMREPSAMEHYSELLSDKVDYHNFCQYIFYKQWADFRAKLKSSNIELIGDIPIYVAYDSADVWAHSECFVLTEDRRPHLVAGVPPDYFSADGQLWGNPLYNWTELGKQGYSWWLDRIAQCQKLFDVLRIDHFRAFDSYYAIKYGEPTARKGKWLEGVGYPFLQLVQSTFPDFNIIAEDLGDIPDSVLQLRDRCGLAGMKILQFAFDGNYNNMFLPHNYPQHCVAYLGTHDNDTTVGWWNSLADYERSRVLDYCQLQDGYDIHWKLIDKLSQSLADTVIFSMQDIVGNDTAKRMNIPGTLGCWLYMADNGDFSNDNANRLADITVKYGRTV